MIIKCNNVLSPATKENLGEKSPWLKKNQKYIALAMEYVEWGGWSVYLITDHHDEPGFFSMDGFEVISQKIPSSWITTVEEIPEADGKKVITMLPASWNYPSFFEDIEDQDPRAIELYNKEVEIMYREEGWL